MGRGAERDQDLTPPQVASARSMCRRSRCRAYQADSHVEHNDG